MPTTVTSYVAFSNKSADLNLKQNPRKIFSCHILHFWGICDSEGENPHGGDILNLNTEGAWFVSLLGQQLTLHNTKHKKLGDGRFLPNTCQFVIFSKSIIRNFMVFRNDSSVNSRQETRHKEGVNNFRSVEAEQRSSAVYRK